MRKFGGNTDSFYHGTIANSWSLNAFRTLTNRDKSPACIRNAFKNDSSLRAQFRKQATFVTNDNVSSFLFGGKLS